MPDRVGKPQGNFVARRAEGLIRTALGDTRIVALVGPRLFAMPVKVPWSG